MWTNNYFQAVALRGPLGLVAKFLMHFLMRSIRIQIHQCNKHDCEQPWQDIRYTLEIQWKHDNFFFLKYWDDIATAVFVCAEVAKFSKTVSDQYLCQFCALFSVQSAFSLNNFIFYECFWVWRPKKGYDLLLAFYSIGVKHLCAFKMLLIPVSNFVCQKTSKINF